MNIKSYIFLIILTIGILSPSNIFAEEPIITFHTNYYEIQGAENIFTIYLGASEKSYVDVDCGFGTFEVEVEAAVFDDDTSKIQGTPVTCTVSKEGVVKIYGDASVIDYVDFEGSYITDISWPKLTKVEILNLQHNDLQSLDLSHMAALQAAYVSDNPFTSSTPLIIGSNKPALRLLDINMIGYLDPNFNISDYPGLVSFSAYSVPTLTKADTSKCPNLLQLTIDATNVESVDISSNPSLLILNVSETKVTSLDLSKNPYLTELYLQHEASMNQSYKFTSLDISNNPELQRLYLNGNDISELDLSKCPKLTSFGCKKNHIRSLSFDNNPVITLIDISKNNMDFNTMPLPRTTFSDYVYQQYPLPVDRSYAVGSVLDFSAQVIRTDVPTDAVLYSFSKDDPENPVLLSDEYFKFENGKVTLLKELSDSVYVAFKNNLFPDCVLTSSHFMVKSEAQFGKPTAVMSFNPSVLVDEVRFGIGIKGASEKNPVKFFVDFGNGELQEFHASSDTIPGVENVSGKRLGTTTTVYMPEGTDLTAFRISGKRLTNMNLTQAVMLEYLSVTGCNMSAVNLNYNRMLKSLDLSSNKLVSLNLVPENSFYNKNLLSRINVCNNALSELTLVDRYGIVDLDVSNNKLTEVDLLHATGMVNCNLSNNNLTEVSLQDCEALVNLNIANNLLTEIEIPDYIPLRSLDIAGNKFALPALPPVGICKDYTYAPQQTIQIPTKAPSVNLSSQMLADNSTSYEWFASSDNAKVASSNYKENDGRFVFTNPELGEIYCVITTPAFPDFSGENVLRTTGFTPAAPPTNAFMEFVTANDGNATVILAAANEGSAVYIDWTGEGDMEQYVLKTTYTNFTSQCFADAKVKVYTYDNTDDLTVFSIVNTPLKSIDASKLASIKSFSISGAGLKWENIVLPTVESLNEINLDNNQLETLPKNLPSGLYMLSVNGNNLTSIDLSLYPKLGVFYAVGNQIRQTKFQNPNMWELSLNGNGLESIDLSGLPALSQLWLSNNNLTSLNVSSLENLKVLFIDFNRFDLSTLPMPKSSYYLYNYSNQQQVDIALDGDKIDLSKQAYVGTTPTLYTWYIDSPYFDENGTLVGEDLYENEEYTLENGVTTFLKPFDHIMCVMTNPVFPDLYLYTNFIDVKTAGTIENLFDNESPVEYYDLKGLRVSKPIPGNIYIKRQGNKTSKILIK